MNLKKGTLLFLLLAGLAYTTLAQTSHTLQYEDITIDGNGMITDCDYNFKANTNGTKLTILKSVTEKLDGGGEKTTIIKGIADNRFGVFHTKNLVSLAFAGDSEITTIGNNAFLNNNIEILILPPSLKTIGNSAFKNNSITTLSLPTTLTTVGDGTFSNNNLTTVTFAGDTDNKSMIRSIGEGAFVGNTKLSPITLPLNGNNNFNGYIDTYGAKYNEGVKITNFNLRYTAYIPYELTAEDIDVDSDGIITQCYCDKFYSRNITIPASITKEGNVVNIVGIGSEVFVNKQLISVELPEGLISIGRQAFSSNSLITLILPMSIEYIGSSAFYYNNLFSFTLPLATKEGFRTYWKDSNSVDLGENLTISSEHFGRSFELISIQLVTLTTAVAEQQGGTISATPNPSLEDNQYDINTKVELTATPNDSWRFDKWVIEGENENDKTTTITMDKNKTATAHFVEQVTLTLTIKETGASGVVNGLNAGKNKIDKGADFKLKAMPASGQRFVSWTIGEKTITNEEYTLPATDTKTDISITVTFKAIEQVTLTLDIVGKGSTTPKVGKITNKKNQKVKLTATPNEGWKFDKWVIGTDEITENPTTITLDKNKSVTAHFVEGEEEEAITSILTEVVSATPYPNPVTSQITLKAKDGDLIQLFSPKGEQQYSAQHTGNEVHTIDVSTLPVGVYLVRITDAEGKTTTKRILKK